ncbi:MAG: polysaccharide biosynthesis C-terminal domain-containing protein, partial [Burkholderiaceae bacterium]
QLLACAWAVVALWSNTSYVFLALGQPGRVTILSGLQAAATVAFLIGFLMSDVQNGVGWAMVSSALAFAASNLYIGHVNLGIRWQNAILGLWRPVLGCGALVVAVLSIQSVMGLGGPPPRQFLTLGLSIALGALAYAAAVLGLWRFCGMPPDAEAQAVDIVRKWR